MATTRQRFQFNTDPARLIGGQTDPGFRQGLSGIADVLLKNRDYAAGLADARAREALARESLAFRNDQAAAEAQRWEAEHQLAVRNADLMAQKEAWDEAHPPYQAPPSWVPDTSPGAEPGQLKPAPMGPADPRYQEQLAKARMRTPGTRPLTTAAANMTKDAGEALYNTTYSLHSFRPEYGGHWFAGEGGMNLARDLGIGSEANKQAVDWWSQYRGYVQAIRKKTLYGAALSPTEQASFDSFEIRPGMDPQRIQANLQHQHDIVNLAATRVAGQLLGGGADPTAVEQQLGIRLDSLGFKITRDRNTNRVINIDEFPVIPGLEDIGKYGVTGQPDVNLGGS